MKSKINTLIALLVMVVGLLTACGANPTPPATGKIKISMWTHSAGNPTEIAAIKKMVTDFNAQQSKYEISIQAFPQASYNDSVSAAAVAKKLPCILDLDEPTVANFAWSKYIQALPVTDAQLKEMGVSNAAIGRYQGKAYSLGQFDVALTIYGRKSVLEKYHIRIPTLDQPWTLPEFNGILSKLKSTRAFEYPFDLNPQYTGEWWPYAYSPMVQSFGGDLIDRKTLSSATGIVNGPATVKWGQWFQDLFKKHYANPKPADDQGFLQGRVALWYTGSWAADSVVKKYGNDALFLPTVDFGNGPKIGGGSWQWGISAACQQPEGAWQFIKYLMEPPQIALFSDATGLIPTTEAAAALVKRYAEGSLYRTFFGMSQRLTILRPPTPGYLIISSQFEKAGLKIRDGGNVQNALDGAADAIDRDLQDHNNYQEK